MKCLNQVPQNVTLLEALICLALLTMLFLDIFKIQAISTEFLLIPVCLLGLVDENTKKDKRKETGE
ncbi:hypothetical protein ACVR1I_06130 [Streptococcus cameli]